MYLYIIHPSRTYIPYIHPIHPVSSHPIHPSINRSIRRPIHACMHACIHTYMQRCRHRRYIIHTDNKSSEDVKRLHKPKHVPAKCPMHTCAFLSIANLPGPWLSMFMKSKYWPWMSPNTVSFWPGFTLVSRTNMLVRVRRKYQDKKAYGIFMMTTKTASATRKQQRGDSDY